MDYEHYLCGLLFPRDIRKHYFAVRAFNIELAIIKDVVSSSSSNIGPMRLDFWRQVINSCYKVVTAFTPQFLHAYFRYRIPQIPLLIQLLGLCPVPLASVNYLDTGLRLS